ncbi:hypothetical protein BH10ACT5_BH10ACT5_19250 [soil metagenome]
MRVGIGVTLTWDDEQFVIIAADYRHVTLRSLEADFTRMVDADELVRLPNVIWHVDRADSATGSAARVLDGLDDDERRIVDAWAEHLAVVKAAVDNGQPAKVYFEDVRTAMSNLTSVTAPRSHVRPLAQPYIFPETITTDKGKIYRSEAFRRGCERAGISLIHAAHEQAPTNPTSRAAST